MTTATYSVQIDFDKDSTYGHASSDITSYVLDMAWNNGMGNSEQEFASPATLSLTLDNSSGDWNLEDSGSPFYGLFARELLVRVRATFSSNTYTLFIGSLTALPTLAIDYQQRKIATLQAQDFMLVLLDAEYQPEFQESVTVDQVMDKVFESGQIVLPYDSDYWILDASSSQLGTNTVLPDASTFTNFETGLTTLNFVGDNSGSQQGVSAQGFLREIVAAEAGGRFWFDTRTGRFVFHNRHHDLNPTIAATLTRDDMERASYVVFDEPYSQVSVSFEPRDVGAAGSVLWSQDSTVTLPRGQQRTINARYRDPNIPSARMGGKDFIPPVRGVDLIANTEDDGSGTNVSDKIAIGVEFGANSAKINISNDLVSTAYITTLQVRGTPIRTYQRQQITVIDPDAVFAQGRREKTFNLRAVDDEEFATGFAGYWLAKHKTPLSRFETITLIANKSSTAMTQALTRTIGDAITVTNTEYSHDKDYIIVGERHRVLAGGEHTHEVTWVLKPIDRELFWVLEEIGYTELGITTILAL